METELRSKARETLEELYRLYARRVWGYACTVTPRRDLAEDLAAEAFLALGKRIREQGLPIDPLGYLLETVRCRSIDERRRRKTLPLYETGTAAQESPDSREAILRVLRRLDPPLSEAVSLRIFAEMTFEEAASFVGIPRATMESRYARALDLLAPLLLEHRP